jgi:hypothetical protein
MFRSWQMSIDLDSLRQQQGRKVVRNVAVMADVLTGMSAVGIKDCHYLIT